MSLQYFFLYLLRKSTYTFIDIAFHATPDKAEMMEKHVGQMSVKSCPCCFYFFFIFTIIIIITWKSRYQCKSARYSASYL